MTAFYLNLEKNIEKNTEKFTEKNTEKFFCIFFCKFSVFFSVFFSIFLDGRNYSKKHNSEFLTCLPLEKIANAMLTWNS